MTDLTPLKFQPPMQVLGDMLRERDYATAGRMARTISEMCQAELRASAKPLAPVIQCIHCTKFIDAAGAVLIPQPKTFRITDWQECTECQQKKLGQSVLPPSDR
jgi:hypothetical protein